MTKLLYIEDNEDNIFMLKTRLERKGFEMLIARNGLEGLQVAQTASPDLILLDVGLPIMDGYEIAKKIKADPAIQHIPIIMLTAHVMVEDREKAFQSGANEYEPKPVNMVSLLKKIETLLQNPPTK